tara:strand:- start:7889 stop:8338 length:450 start_codon:yes stop_codon:yes gene_type:complete
MINDKMQVTGDVTLTLTDEKGNLKARQEIKNLVVNTGLTFISQRMIGTSQAVMSHMALGSGTNAAAAGDTALQTQVGNREALDTAVSDSPGVITYTSTFEPGDATGALTEAGIFNASTSGNMLCRTKFDVVNKSSTDTLAITWVVTISV